MSGQCLSASGAGRALTPARHLPLGGPLPRQLGNITWAPPRAADLWSHDIIWNYPFFRRAMPDPRVNTHALLPLTLLPPLLGFAQLACLIHAANVRSEPESNPSKVYWFQGATLETFENRIGSLLGVDLTQIGRTTGLLPPPSRASHHRPTAMNSPIRKARNATDLSKINWLGPTAR